MKRTSIRYIALFLFSFGLLQACSAFKDDKCNECPKWEMDAPKAEPGR